MDLVARDCKRTPRTGCGACGPCAVYADERAAFYVAMDDWTMARALMHAAKLARANVAKLPTRRAIVITADLADLLETLGR